jgi:hypothetical protein
MSFCFVCPSQPRCLSVDISETADGAAAMTSTSTPASPSHSRPESPLSRQNSSGYGSTRSKAEQTSLSSAPAGKLSSSNPDLGSSPDLPPDRDATPAPRVEGRQSQKLSSSSSAAPSESQTLPRVQGRKCQRPSSVNIIKPLEISRLPFVISPPPKAPQKTITLQKTEKIVTTVSIQNITNSNYKKPPPPIPPPGRPLVPPSTLELPKRATSTPKCPVHPNGKAKVSPSSSSSSSSYTSTSDSSATSTSTVRQFHSLQRPKSKDKSPNAQFYSLRRTSSGEMQLLPQKDSVKLAKSTPNIAREVKAPVPTPRSLKASFSFTNPSSPIARVLFSKPLYQNVPVRISPNTSSQKDEPLTEQVRAATPPSVVSLCPKPVASWTLFL